MSSLKLPRESSGKSNDEAHSKLDHALKKGDLDSRDRENFKSCIISEDVLHPFEEATDAKGIIIYLKLLKMTVEAYIVKSTSVKTRKFVLSM